MRNFIYPAKLTPDEEEGGFVVTFRDVPMAISQGETEAEALENGADALGEAVAGFIDDDEPIPAPSSPLKGERLITLPLQMSFKAALYLATKEKHMSKRALAKLLQVDEKEARRLLDPHHGTRLPVIERALAALGKYVEVRVG